jgi:hypothetical protein
MKIGSNARSLASLGAAALLAVSLLACGRREIETTGPTEAPTAEADVTTGTNPAATPGNTPDTDTTPGGIAGETEPGSTPTPEPEVKPAVTP